MQKQTTREAADAAAVSFHVSISSTLKARIFRTNFLPKPTSN
jgi:hypothetical protein